MRLENLKLSCYMKRLVLLFLICSCLGLLLASCVTTEEPQKQRKRAIRRNCSDCHQDLSAQYQKGIVHAPVKENNCAACHLPHGVLGSLLMRDYPPTLCFRCHIDMKSQQSGLSVHQPVAEGECDSCHNPHNSEYPSLLNAAGNEACFNCHEQEDFSRSNIHAPVLEGCLTCHVPHKSDNRSLLAKNISLAQI